MKSKSIKTNIQFLGRNTIFVLSKQEYKWWVVSNQEGNCSVGCFPSHVWREKLAVLWPFVKRIVTICHKHIVTSFDYSAKAQINLSDGINIICVYILNLSKHTFSRRSRSNITQKGHTNWNSTRKLKCLGINGEYHSSISATVVFVLKCVKKIEKCCCEYQRCIHSSLEMDISERVYWWYPLS